MRGQKLGLPQLTKEKQVKTKNSTVKGVGGGDNFLLFECIKYDWVLLSQAGYFRNFTLWISA